MQIEGNVFAFEYYYEPELYSVPPSKHTESRLLKANL